MPIVKELRIPLPMTVEEFQIGQLYSVAEASKEATTGQTAIEILVNEPFDDPIMGKGQYTHKLYHIAGIIQAVAPTSALKIDERAWNAYPYCKTVFTNEFLGERFELMVESTHLPDDGSTENALNCDQKKLTKRKVQFVDIREHGEKEDVALDASKVASVKANRGPLGPEWQKTTKPLMCCYKLITIKFQVFGLQGKLESTIEGVQKDILTRFYKQVYCKMDQWYGLDLDDIRRIEEETKTELEGMIAGLNLATKPGSSDEAEQLKGVPVAKENPADPILNLADTNRERAPREL